MFTTMSPFIANWTETAALMRGGVILFNTPRRKKIAVERQTKIEYVTHLSTCNAESLFTVGTIVDVLLVLPPYLVLRSANFLQLDLKMCRACYMSPKMAEN